MSDDPLKLCPSCHEPSLRRKIGLGAGIIFKGGGFYETDFKDRKGGPAKEEGAKADTASKPEAGESVSKSDKKTESKPAEPAKKAD